MTAPLTTVRLDEQPGAGADRPLAAGPAPGSPPDGRTSPTGLTVVPTARRRAGRRPGAAHLTAVPEAGMATAEYAVALIAACAFAAVLLAAIRTNAVMSAIGRLITTALKVIS